MLGILRAIFRDQGAQEKLRKTRPNTDRIRRLSGDGNFDAKVAGTSRHQDAIRRTENGLGSTHSGDFLVTLVPEPSNTYDSNAIKVTHKGNLLGYIPADMTSEIHLALSEAGIPGNECKVMARIVGHGKETLGLRLNIARPARLA